MNGIRITSLTDAAELAEKHSDEMEFVVDIPSLDATLKISNSTLKKLLSKQFHPLGGEAELELLARSLIANEVRSVAFQQGLHINGYRIMTDPVTGVSTLYIGNIVADQFVADQTTIQKVASVGGVLVLSQASADVLRVDEVEGGYKCWYKPESGLQSWEVLDQAFCKTPQKSYWQLVTSVSSEANEEGEHWFEVSATNGTGGGVPTADDKVMLLGHQGTDVYRQRATVLSSGTLGFPDPIVHYRGVSGFSLLGKEFINLGGDESKITTKKLVLQSDDGTESIQPNDRGDWSASNTYSNYDRVYHNGSIWQCVDDTTTDEPKADSINWVEVTSVGSDALALANSANNAAATAQSTANSAQSNAQNIDAKTSGIDTIIDATSLNENTYYPVLIKSISSYCPTTISVRQSLSGSSSGSPSWSRHNSTGFALNLVWTSNGSGWGTIAVSRNVLDFEQNWSVDDQSPVGSIGQMSNSSNEYVYVRGGAKYIFNAYDHKQAITDFILVESSYTQSSQTVTTKTYSDIVVPTAINKIPENLGYSSYLAMVEAAVAGKTIVNIDGTLNAELIKANAIKANMIDVTDLVVKQLKTSSGKVTILDDGSITAQDATFENATITGSMQGVLKLEAQYSGAFSEANLFYLRGDVTIGTMSLGRGATHIGKVIKLYNASTTTYRKIWAGQFSYSGITTHTASPHLSYYYAIPPLSTIEMTCFSIPTVVSGYTGSGEWVVTNRYNSDASGMPLMVFFRGKFTGSTSGLVYNEGQISTEIAISSLFSYRRDGVGHYTFTYTSSANASKFGVILQGVWVVGPMYGTIQYFDWGFKVLTSDDSSLNDATFEIILYNKWFSSN